MRVLTIAAAAVLSFSGAAWAGAETSVSRTSEAFHDVLLTCGERIWPGLDWGQTQMLFASETENKAWLVSPASRTPETLALSDLPEQAKPRFFSFLEFRGKTTVAVNLDRSRGREELDLFQFATHELFHHVGQKGWLRTEALRGKHVPLEARPRYLRNELFLALKEALSGNAKAVDVAAFWFQQWRSGFPEEVVVTTDQYEGTARYVDELAAIFARHGCGISDAEVQVKAADWAAKEQIAPTWGLDAEGYFIGAVASFLLDQTGGEWKSKIPAGATPLDLLFAAHPVEKREDDKDKLEHYRQALEGENKEVDAWRVPLLDKLADTSYVRLSVPGAWVKGGYSPKGFYLERAVPGLLYTPFNGPHTFGAITVEDAVVGVEQKGAPCTGGAWFVLVPRASVAEENGRFKGEADGVKFDVTGVLITEGGFPYLCPDGK